MPIKINKNNIMNPKGRKWDVHSLLSFCILSIFYDSIFCK